MTESRVIIDSEKYGERTEFATIEEAQQAIRDCGPEYAETVLEIMGGDAVYDQDRDCVGRLDY
jgi:hypothetical protein